MHETQLLNAPDSAINLIIQLMNTQERAKLSMCSSRAEEAVKRTKPQATNLLVFVGRESTAVLMYDRGVELRIRLSEDKSMDMERDPVFTRWCQAIKPEEADRESYDLNQKALDIAQRLHSVFTPKKCDYHIRVHRFRGNDLKDLVNRTFVLPFNSVHVSSLSVNSSITADEANFLINKAPSNGSLSISCQLPIDFQNENVSF
uniref:F-box domain-containing protein n=1 Tax=Caenorhabditis tropicalis TaxID=1561998 RepID=A0A1I7UC71_9PELO